MTDLPPAPRRGSTAPSRTKPAITALVVVGVLAVAAVGTTSLLAPDPGTVEVGQAPPARPATAIDGALARVETAPPDDQAPPAPAPEAVEEPVEVLPVDVGRIDFTGVTCDMIGDEAVYISQGTPDLPIRLLDVRDTYPIEDFRPEYPLPADGGESTVMSCGGTGDWDDTSSSDVYLELTVDSDGVQYVYYLRE